MTTSTKPKTVRKPAAKSAPKPVAKAAAKPETLSAPEVLTAKAREVYAKGSGFASEVSAFTKANAMAIGASGKILGAGLKQLGTEVVAEGKVAVATVKGDFTDFRGIKSPVELVKFQSKILGRNLGAVTAFGIKHADELVKLAEASALPIAHRVEVVAKTIKKAA